MKFDQQHTTEDFYETVSGVERFIDAGADGSEDMTPSLLAQSLDGRLWIGFYGSNSKMNWVRWSPVRQMLTPDDIDALKAKAEA